MKYKKILAYAIFNESKFPFQHLKNLKHQEVVDPFTKEKLLENFGTVQCILLLLVRWNFAQLTVCFQLLLFRQQSSREDGKVNLTQ